MRGRHCHEHPGLEAARAQAGIASNARQSRRADAGSIHSRGEAWVWALGADADSGLLQLSAVSEGFESGLVVSDGRGVPRRGGAGRLRVRRDGAQAPPAARATDQPCVSSRALIRSTSGLDPWRRSSMRPAEHARAVGRGAMPSGRSWHSGDPDSERRRSTWNVTSPGARVSRTLRGPWEHKAHNAERPQSLALHQISGARNCPGLPLWRRRSSTGARLEHQWPVCHRLP